MSELGDALVLMVGAAGCVPPMRVVLTVTTYPAAAAEARRMGSAMPVPFGALRDVPDGVVPTVREDRSEVVGQGAMWRTRRVSSTSGTGPSSTPERSDVAGFDGSVGWRLGGSPGVSPPLSNPLAKLLDPTWLLSHRTLTVGPTVTVSDRPAFTATAEWRDAGRFAGAVPAVAAPAISLVIDAEFGFLLHYEQTRDGQPIRAETLSELNLDDAGATDPSTYQPPPDAARTDDRDDGWARIPGWQQRLFAAGPLALGAWRVLRGKPPIPVPALLHPEQAGPHQ